MLSPQQGTLEAAWLYKSAQVPDRQKTQALVSTVSPRGLEPVSDGKICSEFANTCNQTDDLVRISPVPATRLADAWLPLKSLYLANCRPPFIP